MPIALLNLSAAGQKKLRRKVPAAYGCWLVVIMPRFSPLPVRWVVTNIRAIIGVTVRAARLFTHMKLHEQVLLVSVSNSGDVRVANRNLDTALPHPFTMSFRSTKF